MQNTGEEIVYVNGQYCASKDAHISIYDRGFLMADAVYEVCAVVNSKLIDNDAHLARLQRSLNELQIPLPLPFTNITAVEREIIQHNHINNGGVYLQVTRGTAPRDFLIDPALKPTLVVFPLFNDPLKQPQAIRVQTQADIRWLRRDIKTTQLLAQSLAKTLAHAEGYDDAWFVDSNGFITEGSSNNAYIVKGQQIYTHPATHDILNGITRQTMIRFMAAHQLELVEQPFTIAQALSADEAFITSAANWAVPVVNIDGHTIGDGKAGKVTTALHQAYLNALEQLSQ